MSFTIKVPDMVIDYSQSYCRKVKMGHRNDGSDGNFEQQLVGVIGQNMVNLALCQPLLEHDTGFDGGFDFELFGMRFDVKTMGRTTGPRMTFVNNLLRSQIKFQCDAYLFLSFNKLNQELSFCGWITKEMFLTRAKVYEKDTERQRANGTSFYLRADTFEIENYKLNHDFLNWPELVVDIHKHTSELFIP